MNWNWVTTRFFLVLALTIFSCVRCCSPDFVFQLCCHPEGQQWNVRDKILQVDGAKITSEPDLFRHMAKELLVGGVLP